MTSRIAVVAAALLIAAVAPAHAYVNSARSFAAAKVDKPPSFDLALTDPEWQHAVKADDFHNLTRKQPAALQTTAYLLYDARNLYVAFRAEQRGVPIIATQTTNNVGLGLDDGVGVGIDTSANGTQVYFFETTPRGVRYQTSTESARYNPPWNAQVGTGDGVWAAMLTIPLSDLRGQSASVQTWRFNFHRRIAGAGERYSWAYDGLMGDAPLDSSGARWWPTLTGINVPANAARPRPHGEVFALSSSGTDRNRFQDASGFFSTQPVRSVGADLTYPLTSSIAFVGTANPDYSNVETDQLVISPQEFRRQLAEYRPFFAQGAQFFNPSNFSDNINGPPNLIFYSPSIGPFYRGEKIEGTFGKQSLGLLQTVGPGFDDLAFGFKHSLPDRTFGYWLAGADTNHDRILFADPRETIPFPDVGRDLTVDSGIFMRNLHTGFVAAFEQARESGTFVPDTRQALFSQGFIDVHKTNYEAFIGAQDVGPYYSPRDGFTLVNDVRGPVVFLNFNGSGHNVKKWSSFLDADRWVDRNGNVHEADAFANIDATFTNLVHVQVGIFDSELALFDLGYPAYTNRQVFPFNTVNINLDYAQDSPKQTSASYSAGHFFNYYLQQFGCNASRQLSKRVSIGFEYDGTHQQFNAGGTDGQILRRVTLGESFGATSSFNLSVRSINGNGGFGAPGTDIAAGYHTQFHSGDELFVNYGTPAATTTLHRLIVKFIKRFGAGTGT